MAFLPPRSSSATRRRLLEALLDRAGQASVELMGILPALALAAVIVWQLLLAGHAAWLCASAASAGARAAVVGRDHEAAVRSVLTQHLERGLRVELDDRGTVRVRVRVPLVVRAWQAPLFVSASTALGRRP